MHFDGDRIGLYRPDQHSRHSKFITGRNRDSRLVLRRGFLPGNHWSDDQYGGFVWRHHGGQGADLPISIHKQRVRSSRLASPTETLDLPESHSC